MKIMKGKVIAVLAAGVGALAAATLARSFGRRRRSPGPPAAAPAADAMDIPHVTPEEADRAVTIIDNGGRPFVVRLSYKRKVATVYLVSYIGDDELDSTSKVFRSFRYKRAFIGLDPREPEAIAAKAAKRPAGGAEGAGGSGTCAAAPAAAPPRPVWWHGGNTVLLDLGDGRCVFIGLVIFSFTPEDEIVGYVSKMGNSAVPYPFAVGTKNTYLMIERTHIPNHIVKLHDAELQEDPYGILYDENVVRWLPETDPKEEPKSGHVLSQWAAHFPLNNYTLIHDRRWDY